MTDFSCNFSVVDTEFTGELAVTNDGECIFNFYTPTEIYGTKITVNTDAVLVETAGYVKKFDIDSIPEYSFTLGVFQAINSADKSNITSNGDFFYIKGSTDNNSYNILFSHIGTIDSIVLLETNTEISFSNVIKQ